MQESLKNINNSDLKSDIYSFDENIKRKAIYRILFDRRTDLLPELKKAIHTEKNEQLAVFMVQVCLTLTTFPRNSDIERRILKYIDNQENCKISNLPPNMWDYLTNSATSQMIIAILASMGNSIPSNSYDFIEMCLTHPDPDVRTMACDKAIKSGRPSHFAYVLNLITDKDPIVSETAFLAIKNLPQSDLSIILDYSLGSPDEWVLNTIAPFLPKLIDKNLRPIIAKVQYHSNKFLANKAKEALKTLNLKHIETNKKETELLQKQEKETKPYSFKDRLEERIREREEKERIKKQEEDALTKEIFNVKSSELEEFEKELSYYENPQKKSIIKSSKSIVESEYFSEESSILANIDDNDLSKDVLQLLGEPTKDPETKSKTDTKIKLESENDSSSKKESKQIQSSNIKRDLDYQKDSSSKKESEQITKTNSENKIDFNFDFDIKSDSNNETKAENESEINLNFEDYIEQNTKLEEKTDFELSDKTEDYSNAIPESIENLDLSSSLDVEQPIESNDNNSLDSLGDIKVEEIDLSAIDFEYVAESINKSQNTDNSQVVSNSQNEQEDLSLIQDLNTSTGKTQSNTNNSNLIKNDLDMLNIDDSINIIEENSNSKDNLKNVNSQIENNNEKVKEPQIVIPTKISIPANIKEIVDNYPSFLIDPLLEIYKANNNDSVLQAIDKVLTNLTAFLNICFLQSVMYYAQESEMLTKSIKDCIKGNLTGPSSIRCLHNFALAMKVVRGNNSFFTFPLSKIMASSIETNPLMMMRELKEFLREPEEPLNETLPQAIDGLIEILKGVESITTNKLVMRAPKGAKLPYADLSGPVAKALQKEMRPSIDLPVGEVVLISKDGGEAFGLYPFFKYQKKKVVFNVPTQEELAVFYERLEIVP